MESPRSLSFTLSVILFVARHSPLGRGRARKMILKFIRQRVHHPIITTFRGIPFIFNLDNTTEAKALCGHYNLEELAFMEAMASAHPHPVLVDLGANSGFYTQNFIGRGSGRTALAIEPNPAMCQRIHNNYELLKKARSGFSSHLMVACCAVGAHEGTAMLDVSQGLGCAHVRDATAAQGIPVVMRSLREVLTLHGIERIDIMKVDIEGYEDRALIPFFMEADLRVFPRNIIIEHTSCADWTGDLLTVLKNSGYIEIGRTRGNLLLRQASYIYATYSDF